MISYADGQFIPTQNAAIPIDEDTAGSIRGFRIFTTAIAVNGQVTFAIDHCNRIIDNAAVLKMNTSLTVEQLKTILDKTMKQNPATSAPVCVKIILTGGKSESPYTPSTTESKLYITVAPITLPPAEYYTKGVALATYPYQRDLASIKLTYYIGGFLAEEAIKKHNAQFPLFTSPDTTEKCLEGNVFNIFFIKNKTIFTPKADGLIFSGITRKVTIRLAITNHYTVIESNIPKADISSFDEAFLTSSIRKVMPVVKIDDIIIGNGKPGPITQQLHRLLSTETGY